MTREHGRPARAGRPDPNPTEEEPVALCPTCRTPIPCHCHVTPAVQLRPGVYAARPDTRSDTMTTDPTAADARARIAAALSPMTVVGGTPPQLLVPVLDASNPRMARIADWQPLDALVEALLAAVSVPPPPPARSATRGLSVPHRDALWDAVAPPGPARPTFPEQHERVCRAVAEILDEVAPPVPAADRAAVLSEAAQRLYTALFPAVYADMGQKAAEGVNRAVSELRRLADEEQPGFGPAVDCQTGPKADSKADEEQPAEVCGKTFGVSGDEYPPCARRPGHREAYCRSADGSAYFLAALREEQPDTEAWVCKCPAELCRCHHAPADEAQQDGARP